jgi:hypothetical protein
MGIVCNLSTCALVLIKTLGALFYMLIALLHVPKCFVYANLLAYGALYYMSLAPRHLLLLFLSIACACALC